jgi:hypothetical protein
MATKLPELLGEQQSCGRPNPHQCRARATRAASAAGFVVDTLGGIAFESGHKKRLLPSPMDPQGSGPSGKRC